MKVELILTDELLGTACANPEIHREYIASKSKDADKVEEELAQLSAEELEQKSMTVFPKDDNGNPIVWDYQIKGFIKEAVGILIELGGDEIKVGKTRLTKFTFKRIVDNYIHVFPRQIAINGERGKVCVRPLRADTMKGERVSLAASETVKAGATIAFEIRTLTSNLDDLITKCLDYGAMKGLGQWRNSGKGRFTWKEVATV